MKKVFSTLILLTFLITACSDKSDEVVQILPSQLLSIEEVSPYLEYTPEMSEESSRRVSVAKFTSNPLGKADPVIITLYQENGLMSAKQIREYYDECKKMRSDSFGAAVDADDAFIAYPSLHYYIDGYHVVITAGSGSNDLQKVLLTNLANISLENLIKLTGVSKTTTEEDIPATDLQ